MSADKDLENFESMTTPLAFAEHLVGDFRRLEPAAWVFWQAVETLSGRNGKPGSNWGLIKMDLAASAPGPQAIHITRKYWAMANFSRYVRPGYRLVPIDDIDSIAALSPDGATLVVVHVNAGVVRRDLSLATAGYRLSETVVTDATHNAAPVAGSMMVAQPRSVTTFVLRR